MSSALPPEGASLTDRIMASIADPKAAVVLQAGYACFLQFGLKRTSMQDIAERAGMSRAALYLHYRNKEDIFRALMQSYFQAAAAAAAEALAAHDDPADALRAAFEAQTGDAASDMMRSPHADELLSIKHAAAREVVGRGQARLAQVYADWLASGLVSGTISPLAVAGDPRETAGAILAALDGLKHEGLSWDAYLAARDRLAVLMGRGLRP